jgi:hypothetical protein
VHAALVAALGVALSGCYSKATGYNGKLTFAYAAGLQFENFGKPIAPGAKLDLEAFTNGTDENLVITAAVSSRPQVIAIGKVTGNHVVLLGGEPGVADIELTARDGAGNTVTDRMFLHVAKPTAHRLQHACTENADAAYVLGENVNVLHELATSDGRPVIGYAYAPVRVAPEAPLELIGQPQGASMYVYRARAATAQVSIRSTVDDSALTARIVKRGDLKDATLVCDDGCKTIVGQTRYVVAKVTLGETPVCSQNALTKARSLTPEICTVTTKLVYDDAGNDSNREQLATITGLKFGVCRYEVSLPELDGGRGVRLNGEAKVGRLEFPGEGSSPGASPGVSAGSSPEARPASRVVVPRIVSVRALLAFSWIGPKLGALAVLAWKRRRRERKPS